MHGNRAAISHSDGLTSGGKGFEPSGPNEENYAHETAPFVSPAPGKQNSDRRFDQ